MIVSPRIHGLLHWRRIACLGIAATLLSVLCMTAPANAETSDAISVPASPQAAEVAASVEQVGTAAVEQAPVEEVETGAAPSAVGEVDVPTAPAEAGPGGDVASAPSSSAVPPATSSVPPVKDIVSSVPSPGEATRSASAAVSVDVPSGADPGAVDPNTVTGRVVVKEAREGPVPERHVAALVDGARRRSTETIAAAAGRLTVSSEELALPPGPLTSAISAGAEEMQPSAAAPVVTETGGDRPTPFSSLQRRSGLLPNPSSTELRPGLGEHLSADVLDITEAPRLAPHHWRVGLSPRTEIVETALVGAHDSHLGGPAAPGLPPPAPQSPATAVGDAGGPSSVPVVALLALLALAAPAARRRLGEVAAFRPPTPFVCALERPG